MGQKKGSSLLETKRRNRVCIKDTIFRMEPITRTDIAKQLGLTLPTITTSINEMIEEKILEELPIPEEKLSNGAGRKPVAIGFTSKAALAIGVELGPYATRAVLMNIKGDVLYSSEEPSGAEKYNVMVDNLAVQIKECMAQADESRLVGVGVGLPGFIECDNGIIRSHREKDWVGRHFAKDLEEKIQVPVIIGNNVHLRAVGYGMEQRGNDQDSFAYLYISKGIACPFMVKESVVSGYTSGAGEIGHTILYVDSRTRASQRCLDDLAGERMILEKCKDIMKKGGAQILKEILEKAGNPELEIKQILEAQKCGDADVVEILDENIEYLGVALANVVNLLNPRFVVVDGYIMTVKENRERLKQYAKEKFFGINEEEVNIVFRSFEHFNGAKGAAYFMIRKKFLEK